MLTKLIKYWFGRYTPEEQARLDLEQAKLNKLQFQSMAEYATARVQAADRTIIRLSPLVAQADARKPIPANYADS